MRRFFVYNPIWVFATILTVLFVILRASGVIAWSLWAVFSPLLILTGAWIILLIIYAIASLFIRR